MYTAELIKSTAPAIFTNQPSPKMSSKYVFVPTFDIMDKFENEGWTLSSVTQTGRGNYGLHELRFRNGELPKVGDSLLEAVVTNSHNGTSSLSVSAGLYRLVCSNGLTVPTSVAEAFKLRHSGFSYDDVKRLTDDFAVKLPTIQGSVNRMMSRELSQNDKIDFIKQATEIRWKAGSVPNTLDVLSILDPNREGDQGDDLWSVFNVVQEKFVRGGVEYTSGSGRKTGLRQLKNILAVNQINTKLWDLAETMC
jgi:hypothetical protein